MKDNEHETYQRYSSVVYDINASFCFVLLLSISMSTIVPLFMIYQIISITSHLNFESKTIETNGSNMRIVLRSFLIG